MINHTGLKEALFILAKAQHNLDLQDYKAIWGEHLGNHIWRQEGSDLIRIWGSGLTHEQAEAFVVYILDKFQE